MAYIPTIHTFEDDINENRGFDEPPISGGVNNYNLNSDILVKEKSESTLTKKILTFIAILFILASFFIVGYYFYGKWKATQEEARLNREAEARLNMNSSNSDIQNDISKIFPKLAPGISPFISQAVQKNNIVILTIKEADLNTDNYTLFYAYILAHKKDLNSDLFFAFKIDELIDSLKTDNELDTNYSYQGDSSLENKTMESFITKAIPMTYNDLVWENKTLSNLDFEAANAGVLTLIYGYSGKKYVIFTTSLKNFFDTISSLQ